MIEFLIKSFTFFLKPQTETNNKVWYLTRSQDRQQQHKKNGDI